MVYSPYLPQYIAILLQFPLFLLTLLADRLRLPGIIRKHDIDLLISDNRFGLWSRRKPCVYITHQLRIPLPRFLSFAGPFVSAIHRYIAGRYDECWIPDLPGEKNLSGRLSHECRLPDGTRYIGILSRFALPNAGADLQIRAKATGMTGYTLALLSGPEPQRSILENIILSQKDKLPGSLVIVAGRPGHLTNTLGDGLTRYSWLDGASLVKLVEEADLVICRPGYSTVMDLFTLRKTALLVPTPGQPEQEYLAEWLSGKYGFSTISQKELARTDIIPPVQELAEWPATGSEMLDDALEAILKNLP